MGVIWYALDPGLSGTGLASFRGKKLETWEIFTPKGEDFTVKTYHLVFWLNKRISPYSKIFIEWPTGNFGGQRGIAAQNSDSIIKLSFLIGAMWIMYPQSELIRVQTWKGQLSKELVQKRAEVFFQKKGFTSHAADAVGLGQYVIEQKLLIKT